MLNLRLSQVRALYILLLLFAPAPLRAESARDRAANKRIDQAINEQYLATHFNEAEKSLTFAIRTCGDKCSAPVVARAFMYLGIVRGSGKNDLNGAHEAFAQAVALDPAVKLDADLATVKTVRAFEMAGGQITRGEPEPKEEPPKPTPPKRTCTPGSPGCSTPAEKPKQPRGGACAAPAECEPGLDCISGICSAPGTCHSDLDCGAQSCIAGVCSTPPATSTYKKNWLGIHAAQDFAFLGGDDVCSSQSQANDNFVCYLAGTKTLYTGVPQAGRGDNIFSGFIAGTTRFLLSYDHAFSPGFMLGARAGYAINGGPPAADGKKFLPYHFELRSTIFPVKDSLFKTGLRPFLRFGGGLAQVNAKLPVTAVECSLLDSQTPNPDLEEQAACARGVPAQTHPTIKLDAYKRLGPAFVAVGGGATFAFSRSFALELDLNGMFMVPSAGVVFQPSLGALLGF